MHRSDLDEAGSAALFAKDRPRSGFSLVELLVVIAVIALMVAAAIPAINGIGRGQAMGKTIDELSALIEYARTEAMARSTYVWVGFTNRTNSANNAELMAMVFASRDGTATAKASDNLIEPMGKPVRFGNIQLTDRSQIDPKVQALLLPGTTAALSDNTDPKTLPAVQGVTFDRTITFAPGGEAMLVKEPSSVTGFDNVIDISLRPMRGTNPDPSTPDHASIWLYGATGRLQVYRLQ